MRDLHASLCKGLQPDLTLLLLPDFDRSLARARQRNQRAVAATGSDENRFEKESSAFYRRVFDKYQEIAAREPLRVVAIDSDGSIDEVHQSVVQVVHGRLSSGGHVALSCGDSMGTTYSPRRATSGSGPCWSAMAIAFPRACS